MFIRSFSIVMKTVIVVQISVVLSALAYAEVPLLERDVLPILTKNCMGCHGGLHQEGELDLRTVPAMLKGGESGPAIVVGSAAQSKLWKQIDSDEMPEGKDHEKLTREQKAIIRTWIDQGLPTVSARQEGVDPLLPADRKHDPQEVAAAIDKHVVAFLTTAKLTPTSRSEDAEFVRRVYLDLAGRVPSAEQAIEFLDSEDASKRAKLIDALLAAPEFGKQYGRAWRDWVAPSELPSDMNGGKQPHNETRELGKWFARKFASGESWDKITRDVLTVQGDVSKNPQAIFFGLAGQGGKTTPDGSARLVASLFMGVQLQCAQCHDDPYRDWGQKDHWGLAAFFGRPQGDLKKIEVGKGPSNKPGEIAIPKSAFKNTGTVIPATFLIGTQFMAKNNDDLRKPLADWLTAKDNPYFARAFANRTWFYLFSRGIVNPIDDFRALNPPSHPGLMKLLTNEFKASGYDVKHLFRCLCNSLAYQRTSDADDNLDQQTRAALTTAFGRMPVRVMTADMLFDSLKSAYGDQKLDLRTVGSDKENTSGESAPVGDAYLEFQRRFGTNEHDPTDFTHGIAQMLTMINHPRLLAGSQSLDEYAKRTPDATPGQTITWLYLSTLSRRPTQDEMSEAKQFVEQATDAKTAYNGVLWTLVNRSEFILVR